MYAKIVISLDDMGNAAFDDGNGGCTEAARILYAVAEKLQAGYQPAKLMDINGNSVGTIKYTMARGGKRK